MILFYLHKLVTRMDVEWICGLREGKRALWDRSYFGTGEAEYDDYLGGSAWDDMEHRAYSEAIGPIVKAYVEDLVEYFNSSSAEDEPEQ
ncbi:MAG: hypothetical protein Q8R92_06510 [Deltaproteobacteria bacterium]|nr:hypothetical protein [Deltaproteobacteria bacterium]